MNVSQESPSETESRLRRVLKLAEVQFYEEAFQFEETPLATAGMPMLDRDALALIRDGDVLSQLVPTSDLPDAFGLFRVHFPADVDNSGFVGWLASLLKSRFGTGVFVICGQNSTRGGIFDYWGCPLELRERVFAEIRRLRSSASHVGRLDLQGRRFRVVQNDVSYVQATKVMTGHSDLVLGHAATTDPALAAALRTWRTQHGAIPGPMEVWLAHRSLATLALRLRQQCATAGKLASYLASRPEVARVYYPGLESHPNHAIAERQMDAFGTVVSFDLSTRPRAEHFLGSLAMVRQATSFGGCPLDGRASRSLGRRRHQ